MTLVPLQTGQHLASPAPALEASSSLYSLTSSPQSSLSYSKLLPSLAYFAPRHLGVLAVAAPSSWKATPLALKWLFFYSCSSAHAIFPWQTFPVAHAFSEILFAILIFPTDEY